MKSEYAENKFNQLCITPSDIFEHLPTLKRYAFQCDHITEMGVRGIVSTWAFIVGNPKRMISYDINHPSKSGADINQVYSNSGSTNFEFIEADILTVDIEETDLLFIDTFHVYRQLKRELELHSSNVNKYIILHDTQTFGYIGEDGGEGLRKAVTEFLNDNKYWTIYEDFKNNNGLMILKKYDTNIL